MRRICTLLLSATLCACGVGRESPRVVVHVLPEERHPRAPDEAEGRPVAWVRVAASPDERQAGLMHVESLAPDHGVLFVYPECRELRFWMKNVRIPLSICFADPSGRIVRILEMEPAPGERDPPMYESREPAIYALEMNRGWFRAKGIHEGDQLRLDPGIEAIRVR